MTTGGGAAGGSGGTVQKAQLRHLHRLQLSEGLLTHQSRQASKW
jgi:hypothetical protein